MSKSTLITVELPLNTIQMDAKQYLKGYGQVLATITTELGDLAGCLSARQYAAVTPYSDIAEELDDRSLLAELISRGYTILDSDGELV